MIVAECEPDGTLRLDDDVRSRYGERFMLLELEEGLLLVPIPDDPTARADMVKRIADGSLAGDIYDQADLSKLPR